jgi:ubiquinone/menaquinone biosynthesis C-methylase UbiE
LNIPFSEPDDVNEWLDEYQGGIQNILHSILDGTIVNGVNSGIALSVEGTCVQMVPFKAKEKCRVLILGCGNSRLGEDMLKDGWTGGITNVDFSPVLISQMKERYNKTIRHNVNDAVRVTSKEKDGNTSTEQMTFICSDVANGLDFQDSSFDLIIHKGLLDAMACHFMRNYHIKSLMNECTRILDQNGAMVCISSAKRENRLEYLEHEDWTGGIWINEEQKPQMNEQRDDQERSR